MGKNILIGKIYRERAIAERLLEMFRKSNCKVGHVIKSNQIEFNLFQKLNPVEQEIFEAVFTGLQALGYFTVDSDGKFYRLAQNGYDYIYDVNDESVKDVFLKTPWIIPKNDESIDWDKAYKKLLDVVIPGGICQIKGSDFYSIASEYIDGLPALYGDYLEQRREEKPFTSRQNMYVDLLNSISDFDKRYLVFVKCQELIDKKVLEKYRDCNLDFETVIEEDNAQYSSIEEMNI